MAFSNFRTLARGQLHATQSILYTGPSASKSTEVSTIWLHNGSGTPYSASLWLQESNLRHCHEVFSASVSFEISPKVPFIIQGTGSIYMVAQQSASINYIITGREEI
jgi:hypothetical protein